jgi:hypothetical protein
VITLSVDPVPDAMILPTGETVVLRRLRKVA